MIASLPFLSRLDRHDTPLVKINQEVAAASYQNIETVQVGVVYASIMKTANCCAEVFPVGKIQHWDQFSQGSGIFQPFNDNGCFT